MTIPGRAEAMLKGSHVTKACYVHQVTALPLSILRREALYMKDRQENEDELLLLEASVTRKEEHCIN